MPNRYNKQRRRRPPGYPRRAKDGRGHYMHELSRRRSPRRLTAMILQSMPMPKSFAGRYKIEKFLRALGWKLKRIGYWHEKYWILDRSDWNKRLEEPTVTDQETVAIMRNVLRSEPISVAYAKRRGIERFLAAIGWTKYTDPITGKELWTLLYDVGEIKPHPNPSSAPWNGMVGVEEQHLDDKGKFKEP